MSNHHLELTLKERARLLPQLPGVYRFYNQEGEVIYIGKAKNLRARVSQYFNSQEGMSKKTKVMVSKISLLEHTVVESEEDALLLENNLIKEFLPRYNVLLKDGKSYPWISIKNEPFPRIVISRRIVKDGSLYFGPYSSALQARTLIELIASLYYIRDCKLNLSREAIERGNYKVCLKYHIGRCKAPCVSLFSEEEYNAQIEGIISILKGESSSLLKEFTKKMSEAASQLNFEEAKLYKEKIDLIRNHNSSSIIVSQTITNVDLFTIEFSERRGYGNFMRVVDGAIIQSLNLEFKIPIEESEDAIMSRFITEIHQKSGGGAKELLVSHLPDSDLLRSRSHIPQRGEKHYLLKLSQKNALNFRKERERQEATLRPEEHQQRIMESIQNELKLKSLPTHIEAFDISNTQGQLSVAAAVVFRDGKPSRGEYRHFNIKSVEGADDYASMREVVGRRFKRLVEEKRTLPQLVVIDGGKGQLSAAYQALKELNLEKRVELIGIAERLEKLISPRDPHPLFLNKNGITLRVIMHLRDEAHRFGLNHHRKRRSKKQIESQLRAIPGVGPKREAQLLRTFGSTLSIQKASLEELREVVGEVVANAIYNHFERV